MTTAGTNIDAFTGTFDTAGVHQASDSLGGTMLTRARGIAADDGAFVIAGEYTGQLTLDAPLPPSSGTGVFVARILR